MSGYPPEWPDVSLRIKIDAGFRCARCHHPNGIWCPSGTDAQQTSRIRLGLFGAAARFYDVEGGTWIRSCHVPCDDQCTHPADVPTTGRDAGKDPTKWRILTVHHLDGVKTNLAWWNLPPLCQRCHLTIQGKVTLDQTYQLPHSRWFLPYVAGYYARVLETQPTRHEVENDLVTFLALGQPHLERHYKEMIGWSAG